MGLVKQFETAARSNRIVGKFEKIVCLEKSFSRAPRINRPTQRPPRTHHL